jgi:hypothetical protein
VTTALQVIGLTILLLATQAALRYAGRWLLWGVFVAVPLALTPYWVSANTFDPFVWVKIYSIFICVGWGTLVRFTCVGERPWARRAIPVLVAVNILEATAVDLMAHGLAHGVNAVAGLMLVATLPFGRDDVRVDTDGRCRDLRVPTSRGWVIGYVLWNWAFVLLNYPELAGHHAAVLAAGLIVGVVDPARWTQTRGATLGVNLMAMATCDAPMRAWLETSSWADPRLALVAASGAAVVALGCGMRAVSSRCHGWLLELRPAAVPA